MLNHSLVLKLALLHIAIIALANYTVQFTATLVVYGFTWHFTWAMFIFPLVILATDLTVRLSNQSNARRIVAAAYLPAILLSAWLADWRIGLASGSAYLVGQLLDIFVFQTVRTRLPQWWVAPLLSTLFANVVDTYIFYAAAFYRATDAYMAANWLPIAHVDLAFKIAVSLSIFLPAYGVLLHYLQSRIAAAAVERRPR